MNIGDRVKFIRVNDSLEDIQISVNDKATITGFSGCQFSNIIFDNGFNYTIENSFIEATKEEKVEKIEVRSWDDLPINIQYYVNTNKEEAEGLKTSFGTVGLDFSINDLEKAIKVLNALGGNFEYKEMKVIDTLEKWEEFQKDLNSGAIYYCRYNNFFIKFNGDDSSHSEIKTNKIEQKYNVNLKIIKEV